MSKFCWIFIPTPLHFSHSFLHLHNSVQDKPAFLQLHLFLQILHIHLISSLQESEISGNSDHFSCQDSSCNHHPQSFGDGTHIARLFACPQMCPAWKALRNTCCCNAPFVGGRLSSGRFLVMNNSCLASLTLTLSLGEQYSSTTYLSIMSKISVGIEFCGCEINENAVVASLKSIHVFQVDFFGLSCETRNAITACEGIKSW